MRRGLVVLGLAACLGIAAGGEAAPDAPRSGAGGHVRGPFQLVSLGSLGSVTWRCDSSTDRYALGFGLAGRWATTHVTLRVGGRVLRRMTVQPGDRVALPFLAADEQRLVIVQQTGARTLRADIRATFESGYPSCFAYLHPSLDVRVRRAR